MAKKLFIKLQTPTVEVKVKASDISGNSGELLVGFKRYTVSELESKFKEIETMAEADNVEFFASEIVYIKNATLEIYDGDTYVEDLVVADTRKVEPNEFFQDSKEALTVLLGYYLNSLPWKNALTNAFTSALVNLPTENLELKN